MRRRKKLPRAPLPPGDNTVTYTMPGPDGFRVVFLPADWVSKSARFAIEMPELVYPPKEAQASRAYNWRTDPSYWWHRKYRKGAT